VGELAVSIDLVRRNHAAAQPDDRHLRADLLLLRDVLEAEEQWEGRGPRRDDQLSLQREQ